MTDQDTMPRRCVAARMAFFDSLPRELRRAIAESDCLPKQWQAICEYGLRRKFKIATILRQLDDAAQNCIARNPAERENAEASLKDLGL